MSETNRLCDQLHRAFEGDAWSGPALWATLRPLTASQAAARPLPQSHSIWEIVLHLTTWLNVGRQRLETQQVRPLADSLDWPAQPTTLSEDLWAQARQHLRAAHQQLLDHVATLPDDALDRVIEAPATGEPGSPQTVYILLHGLAQHNLYHAGQIMLLRKALGL
ncbi:DinB family protein [Hymenobacter aquaticus]|uniref:DinB family protein n=1 Tax=Hymenobacter aquaticus TaxID=1867101 RepID=A0A4Z0PXB5_9BACT|nr:DinB family protein [Hymenobacter aquaticus]TGE21949.1 DinB family protein [Hymenobacter aquaticus]